MTALTIVQTTCGMLGLRQPAIVFASTDNQVIQLRGLMNQSGFQLAKVHQWQGITREKTFTTVAQEVQTGAIPTDFDRFVDNSMFNRSTARQIYGPLTEVDWQQYKAYPIYTTMNPAFMMRGNDLYFQPNPDAGNTCAYSYVSTYWCESSSGTDQTAMAADTDVALIPEALISLDIAWRFKKAKGFDYSEEYRTFQEQMRQTTARDGGAPRLNLAYGLNRFRPYLYNIPDGNWP